VGSAAWLCVVIILLLNVMNYADRFVLSAVLPGIASDLALSDAHAGLLGSMFVVSMVVWSPLFAVLADAYPQKRTSVLVPCGAVLWSAATLASGLARSYASLLVSRVVVGVGEAAFGPVASVLLCELVPASIRARVLGLYAMTAPIGASLGYLVGAGLSTYFSSWRAPFYVAAVTGAVLALVCAAQTVPTPAFHGHVACGETLSQQLSDITESHEALDQSKAQPRSQLRSQLKLQIRRVIEVISNSSWIFVTASMTLTSAVIGPLAHWMPSIISRSFSMSPEAASAHVGAVSILTGVGGSLAGGFLADYLATRQLLQHPHVQPCLVYLVLSAPCAALLAFATDLHVALIALACSQVLIFATFSPLNLVIVQTAASANRSLALSLTICSLHVFGDAPAMWLFGVVSDRFTHPTFPSSLTPSANGLRLAVLLSSLPLLLSGLALLPALLAAPRQPQPASPSEPSPTSSLLCSSP